MSARYHKDRDGDLGQGRGQARRVGLSREIAVEDVTGQHQHLRSVLADEFGQPVGLAREVLTPAGAASRVLEVVQARPQVQVSCMEKSHAGTERDRVGRQLSVAA